MEVIFEIIELDKKSCSEGINLISLKRIGEAFISIRMTDINIDKYI